MTTDIAIIPPQDDVRLAANRHVRYKSLYRAERCQLSIKTRPLFHDRVKPVHAEANVQPGFTRHFDFHLPRTCLSGIDSDAQPILE